jgi:hypothetical protein
MLSRRDAANMETMLGYCDTNHSKILLHIDISDNKTVSQTGNFVALYEVKHQSRKTLVRAMGMWSPSIIRGWQGEQAIEPEAGPAL